MTEAPMKWFETFLNYHKNALKMSQLDLDSCRLYSPKNFNLGEVIGIQVQDTIRARTADFLTKKHQFSSQCQNKMEQNIGSAPTRFSGIGLCYNENKPTMGQTKFIGHIELITSQDELTYPKFLSIKAK